jgi:hypothetical protein
MRLTCCVRPGTMEWPFPSRPFSTPAGRHDLENPALSPDADFERHNEQAIRAAVEADRIEPRAYAVRYDPKQALVLVELSNGCVFGFPPDRVPGLDGGTRPQLSNVRISPSGDGLHWDDLDTHASLTGLVAEASNLRSWAPRIMGEISSEAKARAARKNGLKGGRPRRSAKPPASTD